MQVDERVGRRHRLELVRSADERETRRRCDLGRHLVAELRMRVEPGADGGAPLSQLEHVRQRRLDMELRVGELRDVARELLSERDGRGVLQVGAADLHEVRELRRLLRKRLAERAQRGEERLRDSDRGGDVHRRREDVVRRLAAIDVIVGVHEASFAARTAEDLGRTVRQHLVDVHVGLRA